MSEHERIRPIDYYAGVFGSIAHTPPIDLPLSIIEEKRRSRYLGKLVNQSVASASAGAISVILSVTYNYMSFGGALKIGEVPVAMSNSDGADSARVVRGTHPAQNTLVLSYRPEYGPFTVVQGGFPVASAKYPNVEVVQYKLALVAKGPLSGAQSQVHSIGTRYGKQHQHVLDNFENWVRLDLDPNQIKSSGLPHGDRREFTACDSVPDWIPYLLARSLTQHFNNRDTALSVSLLTADQ